MIPVVVLRPEPGCAATVAAARERGLDARAFPLFAVSPRAWEPPPPASFDALLIGSANALRHGGAALAQYRGKSAYAVGARTAQAARAAGLAVIAEGTRGLQPLLAELRPNHRRLLRLAGAARVEIDPPAGFAIAERIVYASAPLSMADDLAELLAAPALVLLHSALAASHFAAECDRCRCPREHVALAALGPRIADAAGSGWGALAAAASPRDGALLALAVKMCQKRDGSGGISLGT